MNKLAIAIALPALTLAGFAQPRNCLRIMPVDELSRTAGLIARVKVHRVQRVNYRGSYSQLAVLRPVEVIEGDFTLKEMNVLARSNVQCAEDNYVINQEMLVFLEPEEGLFRTVNFQFGQFQMAGDIVKSWRDKANKPIDKPYNEVRQEVEAYVNAAHSPQPEGPLGAGPQPASPQPSVDPQVIAPPQPGLPNRTGPNSPQGRAKRQARDKDP
jgi:hypothetical protein